MLIQLYIIMHINKYLSLFSWLSVYIDITHTLLIIVNYILNTY